MCSVEPIENYNEWRMIYFIAFLLLVGFFVLNMFVGVVVENFHKCKEALEAELMERELKKKKAKKMKKQMSKQQLLQKSTSRTAAPPHRSDTYCACFEVILVSSN